VARVAGDLLDQVEQHPAHRPRLDVLREPRPAFRHRHRTAEVVDPRDRRLGLEARGVETGEQTFEGVRLRQLELPVVRVVVRRFRPAGHPGEPAALGERDVLEQCADRQRARARCGPQLVVRQAVRGVLEHPPLLGEETEQPGPFVGYRWNVRVQTGHTPTKQHPRHPDG
jgi:hypothetical protein